jgi:DNA primase
MQAVLDRATSLADEIWALEVQGRPSDTPERRAALEHRIEEKIRTIADRSVQEHYRRFFRDRFFQAWRPARPAAAPGRGQRGGFGKPARPAHLFERAPPSPEASLGRLKEEQLIATILNHPSLLDEVAEEFAEIDLSGADLVEIRREILGLYGDCHDLDGDMLRSHLCRTGFSRVVEALLGSPVVHAGFARAGADPEAVRRGWIDTRNWLRQQPLRKAQLVEEERGLAEDMTPENWARLQALLESRGAEEEAATEDPSG